MKTPARWWRGVKRRKPGVYAYRTMRHLQPNRSEWGYVGKSRNLTLRDRCHYGTCSHGHRPKDWIDLVIYRRTIQLPWWLGWDWITLSLETIMILMLRPRYNWAKNPRPGKVGPSGQRAQRLERDQAGPAYRTKVQVARVWHLAARALGVILVLVGVGGALWTR